MKVLLDMNLAELTSLIESMGQPKFRAKQVYDMILSGKDAHDKCNLPKSLLNVLEANFIFQPVVIEHTHTAKDKTTKYIFRLHDGNLIEGVLMKYKYGNTLCVSTQVGCKMNCAFCASGLNGWVRNLSSGEILGQYVAVNKAIGGSKSNRLIDKIVLMGTGEPLDNFDNVVEFLRNITSDEGFNLGVRNISLSTCGIPDKIRALADIGLNITLSLSLHAPDDETRKKIMPIAKKYKIVDLFDALDYYERVTSRRIILEYILIKDINSSVKDAEKLAKLIKGHSYHVNLIRLNEVPERGLKTIDSATEHAFYEKLSNLGVSVTIRRTTGDDVSGACGQLRNYYMKNEEDK